MCNVAKAQCRPTREMFMTRKLQPPLGPLKEKGLGGVGGSRGLERRSRLGTMLRLVF